MKTKEEVAAEILKLRSIISEARGIDREDCPELSTKINTLKWVLGQKDDNGDEIHLDIVS